MDDSALLNKHLRKASADMGLMRKKDNKNPLATKSIFMHKFHNHAPSLGLELLNDKDQLQFSQFKLGSHNNSNNNFNFTNINDSTSIKKGEYEENEKFFLENEEIFGTNRAVSLEQEGMQKVYERKFTIPQEPIETEGVLKVDEITSDSDISDFSSKEYQDKEVQVNRDNESMLEKNHDTSKTDLFLADYSLCVEKKIENVPKVDKMEVSRAKFQNPSNKTSLKTDSKFFLMEDDSDDSAKNLKKNSSIKFNKSKVDKNNASEEKPSKKFYFAEIEKKLSTITNLVNDFLRISKENQNVISFDSTKKSKFLNIQISLSDLMKQINREHYSITHELIKKTMIKLDSQTLKTLNYHKLIKMIFEGYTKMNDGHIEYNIALEDIIMKKTWRIQTRYSKLRTFHKECQSFLTNITLNESFNGSLPPFPPKKWFGNTEDEFLKIRQKELENYFNTLLTSPLCVQIIDKGVLTYFFYKEIWRFESDELKQKCQNVEKWETMLKKAQIVAVNANGKNNKSGDNMDVNYETLGQLMKEEIKKISSKFDCVKNDLELLETNDSYSILTYEEKRKKLEKEFSVRESFDENDLKGILA